MILLALAPWIGIAAIVLWVFVLEPNRRRARERALIEPYLRACRETAAWRREQAKRAARPLIFNNPM